MKISCTVCEVAEATVLCCADEAALCAACDEKVHAANKLASKHQKIPLFNSAASQLPKCDICQENAGYFFCLEDRALLCRKCDVAIHTANPHVSSHQRFLLTGVKVGLEPLKPGSTAKSSPSVEKVAADTETAAAASTISKQQQTMPIAADKPYKRPAQTTGCAEYISPLKRKAASDSIACEFQKSVPVDDSRSRIEFAADGGPAATGSTSMVVPPSWHMDDFIGIGDFGGQQHYFSYPDNGTSKADSAGKLGESDSSVFLRSSEEEVDPDEYLGQVPDITTSAIKIPSPPTASGLYWPKSSSFEWESSNTFSVPEMYQFSPTRASCWFRQ